MIDFLLQVLLETWSILKEASIFLLFGFFLAGVLAVLVPAKTVIRFFGRGKVKSVLWSSTIGVPLPLCSCGVLPTALGLRRQGATKGATVSFLISTPETGVDSISLTYALMDPIMTVFRPVAAMATAVTAGIATNFFGTGKAERAAVTEARSEEPDEPRAERTHEGHDHSHEHDFFEHHLEDESVLAGPRRPPAQMVRHVAGRIHHYAFRELFDEISYWLIAGIVASGVVAAALPASFFQEYLSGEFTSMIVMLLIGIPIYTCASASTPIAAAFVLKGLNPGAALVFLLAGPATSFVTVTVLLKMLGARVVAIYLGTIVVLTLVAGYALNRVYAAWDIDPLATFGTATGFVPEWLKIAGAVLMLVMMALSVRRAHVPEEWLQVRDTFARLTGLWLSAQRLRVATVVAAAALYVSSGLFAVRPGDVGVRLRFGEILDPRLDPGLHYRLPWPFESHRVVPSDLVRRLELGFRSGDPAALAERSLARERLTVGGPSNPVPQTIRSTGYWLQSQPVEDESFLLTGDANLLDARVTVQYRVKDPIAFAYGLAEPDALVLSLALSVMRGVVGTAKIDTVYTTGRGEVEEAVARKVQELCDRHGAGIEIVSVRLLYVHPPEEVHSAFRDVASAQEDKLRTINRAETFAIEIVNEAKGEAAAMIEDALAYKHERIRRAQGEADGFALKVEEYARAPELTEFRLQIETIEEVLPGARKLIRPEADDLADLDLWLLQPMDGMGAR